MIISWKEDANIFPISQEYTKFGRTVNIIELKADKNKNLLIGVDEAIAAVGSGSSVNNPTTSGNEGVVFIFKRDSDGTWHEETIIAPPTDSKGVYTSFGYSISLWQSSILIAAASSQTGVVFSYERVVTTSFYPDNGNQKLDWVAWNLIEILYPADSSTGFGKHKNYYI